jgi:hypothetical protein
MATSPNYAIPNKSQQTRRQMLSGIDLLPSSVDPFTTGNEVPDVIVSGLNNLLFELGVEPSLTVHEAAAILRWSYWKARRYFSQVDGICVSYRPKRYKRPYRTFTIPVSVFAREWQKMTGHEPEAADVIRHRLALAIPK